MGLGADSSLEQKHCKSVNLGVFWCGAIDMFFVFFFVGIPKGFRSHDSVFLLGQWNFVGACGCDFWWGWISHLFEIDTVHWCPKNIQVYLNHPNGWLFKSCESSGWGDSKFHRRGWSVFLRPFKRWLKILSWKVIWWNLSFVLFGRRMQGQRFAEWKAKPPNKSMWKK